MYSLPIGKIWYNFSKVEIKEMINESFFDSSGFYRVPIKHGSKIHEVLGRVRIKNDKRFEWTRWRSQIHNNWSKECPAQGVCDTKEQAISKVLCGWN